MAEKYVDQDGNPIPESELHKYAIDEDRPKAVPADRPAPSQRSGARRGLAMVAAIAVLGAGGWFALDRGWVKPTSTPAAASSSAAPETTTGIAAAPTTTGAATTTTTAPPTTAAEPVAVDNSRYTSAKWPLTSVEKPAVRLRVTDSLRLPASAGMWEANVAKAFDRFAPWVTIAATGQNQLTVQTVSRAEVTKSWAESVIDVSSGAPRVVNENSGPNVDDSRDLSDVDGSPPADTGPDSGKPVSYYVDGGEIPAPAKGKRAGQVSVSVIKRDGQHKEVVWFVAGGTLFRAIVEDTASTTADTTTETTKSEK